MEMGSYSEVKVHGNGIAWGNCMETIWTVSPLDLFDRLACWPADKMLPMVHDTHKNLHGHLTDIVWTWLNMFELFRSVWGRPVLQPETNPWQPSEQMTQSMTQSDISTSESWVGQTTPIGSNWFLDDPIVLANLHLSDLHCLRCLRYGGLIDVQRTKCHRSLLLGSGKQLPGRRWYTDMLQFDTTPEAHGGWGSMNLGMFEIGMQFTSIYLHPVALSIQRGKVTTWLDMSCKLWAGQQASLFLIVTHCFSPIHPRVSPPRSPKMPQGCEFAVAQRLILLDRWEAVCNKRRQRVDISATGNRSQLRILVEMVVVGVVANNMMIDLDRFGTGYF